MKGKGSKMMIRATKFKLIFFVREKSLTAWHYTNQFLLDPQRIGVTRMEYRGERCEEGGVKGLR